MERENIEGLHLFLTHFTLIFKFTGFLIPLPVIPAKAGIQSPIPTTACLIQAGECAARGGEVTKLSLTPSTDAKYNFYIPPLI
jgi:hypothetical protein